MPYVAILYGLLFLSSIELTFFVVYFQQIGQFVVALKVMAMLLYSRLLRLHDMGDDVFASIITCRPYRALFLGYPL